MPESPIVVLGCGLVGSAIVTDLALRENLPVLAVDIRSANLERLPSHPNIRTLQADVRQEGVVSGLSADARLFICAVPGFMGFETLRRIIDTGRNVVDISFFPEDAFELDALAREKGVTAVVDCGVAPGLCNVQAGWVQERADRVDSYLCFVGGLPTVRVKPFEYRAVFSPIDVIEEYTRPARYVEHGQLVTREALTDIEPLDLPGAGSLEAFNTDGLRSLIHTLDAPFKKEKTLRYPGHAELMRTFRDTGLFSGEPMDTPSGPVRPIDVTSRLLFAEWKMGPEDRDLTVMRVVMEGLFEGTRRRFTFDLLDHFDEVEGVHSMARTTGYTCTIVAGMMLDGSFDRVGICPPEYLGATAGCYEAMLAGYTRRGIKVRMQEKSID
ncbi:MAG: saccharopine dehydrogenase NADP-binding domain-containing protein [Bacteroidetes bacterium]|nr:saccharopine dehydrogenase NADP-binding domain-containing protein [Bacteroidota bacterium]